MSELYDRIMSQKGSFEGLIMKIPGFKGYQDKAARRKADTMLRDFIAKQISACVQKLIGIENLILDNIGIQYMRKTRDVKGQIQLYHDRVAAAVPGYSGMWAQMKIGPQELEEIYAFDEAQVSYIEKIDAALDALQQTVLSQEGIDLAIMELNTTVAEALEAFALRDDILTRLSESV